jgi:hypothetical protein
VRIQVRDFPNATAHLHTKKADDGKGQNSPRPRSLAKSRNNTRIGNGFNVFSTTHSQP